MLAQRQNVFLETQNLHKPCHEGCGVGGSLSGVFGHPGWAQPRMDQPPVPPSLQLLCRCILPAGIYCPHGDTDQHQQGCLGGDRGAPLLQAMPPQQHHSKRTRETGIVKCAWQSVAGSRRVRELIPFPKPPADLTTSKLPDRTATQ